ADMAAYGNSKVAYIYHSLNFFKVYNELIGQLDELIHGGAACEKVDKREIGSSIHGRNLARPHDVQIPWAYKENGNVIIDYSGLVEWKSLGVYISHRQLVEIKYFY